MPPVEVRYVMGLLPEALAYGQEIGGFQCGSADESAVDILLGEYLGGVRGLAAAAVEYGALVGGHARDSVCQDSCNCCLPFGLRTVDPADFIVRHDDCPHSCDVIDIVRRDVDFVEGGDAVCVDGVFRFSDPHDPVIILVHVGGMDAEEDADVFEPNVRTVLKRYGNLVLFLAHAHELRCRTVFQIDVGLFEQHGLETAVEIVFAVLHVG